jgi:hypothetical protein
MGEFRHRIMSAALLVGGNLKVGRLSAGKLAVIPLECRRWPAARSRALRRAHFCTTPHLHASVPRHSTSLTRPRLVPSIPRYLQIAYAFARAYTLSVASLRPSSYDQVIPPHPPRSRTQPACCMLRLLQFASLADDIGLDKMITVFTLVDRLNGTFWLLTL